MNSKPKFVTKKTPTSPKTSETMRHTAMDSRRTIESCTFHLHNWRPFQLPTTPKTLDSDTTNTTSKPYYTKRPCLSDRATSFPMDALDMSRLSLFDADDRSASSHKRGSLRWIARKRRRRGSRSVSGRSSDRSGTRPAVLLRWGVGRLRHLLGLSGGSGDRFERGVVCERGCELGVGCERGGEEFEEREGGREGNESGYGSEPGYRGDAEFGYGDEVDEEEDDLRLMFWGEKLGGTDSNVEMVGENTLQKAHHRCRRKKHDMRMVDTLG
ncbi:hypothetical protein Acr_17g0001600 [Actinidia rufa]|uniref:Uncharacterized protein n=1 Tax=Actinidia rufa TaxID=165716 RepID=A0A7J0G1C8_9ERIC|nr:hypothetical protein Acr_17g0001600 [Actinidia rufa]